MDIGTFKQRQGLPLECKIAKTVNVVELFYELLQGDVYLSRGGVDSAVLQWIIENKTRFAGKIECVCVASVEPVENISFNFQQGNTLIKSSVSKKKVITDWGYPLISKEVAMCLSRYTRTKLERVKKFRLYGDRGDGKKYTKGVIPKMYRELIFAPFELSEKCCDITKKKPLHDWEKVSKKKPITGELAEESRNRLFNYLKHGCIMHDKKQIKCTPLGPWTAQDIMECIYKYNIKIPLIYGEVKKDCDGKYYFTGEQRTGCEICGFGIMRDMDRFDRLKDRKPNLYREMMNGGKWIRKDLFRWVKFRPNSMPIWSNLYWVPNEKGYGYRFVLNYLYEVLKVNRRL